MLKTYTLEEIKIAYESYRSNLPKGVNPLAFYDWKKARFEHYMDEKYTKK